MEGVYCVIMAGGRGERFWPLSTPQTPKQVLSLFGGKPLIAMAADYAGDLAPPQRLLVITNRSLTAPIREALPLVPPENIIGEPVGRDTAAALALACAVVKARDPNGILCVLTADHIIHEPDLFRQALRDSCEYAKEHGVLMTIGIAPDGPSTAFGYIEAGDAVEHRGQTDLFKAERFVEKPDRKSAERYLQTGRYSWNSGMFVWSARAFEAALARHQPHLHGLAERISEVVDTDAFETCLDEEYALIEKISVDYAIMEKADNIVMARGTFSWDDVGAWSCMSNHFPADSSGNVVLGKCEQIDATDNIVVSNERLTALIGVRDLVVVQSGGATLVCARDRAQDVKMLVKQLREKGDPELLL